MSKETFSEQKDECYIQMARNCDKTQFVSHFMIENQQSKAFLFFLLEMAWWVSLIDSTQIAVSLLTPTFAWVTQSA